MKKSAKKVKRGSLRTRIALVFASVLILVIAIFFLVNTFFWNNYYLQTSENTMKAAYYEISEIVKDQKALSSTLSKKISTLKSENNIIFALSGEDGVMLQSVQILLSNYDKEFLEGRMKANRNADSVKASGVLDQTENYTLQAVDLSGKRYLECFGTMETDNGNYTFVFSAPLESFYSMSKASLSFSVYASAVLVLLGTLLVLFFTWRVTEPIYQLNEITERMSRLDFSARYKGRSNDEIGELGNNVNEMSSQLERAIVQLQLANEELQRDLDEQNRTDDMRKDFVANVSHELKTPIALIQGYAEGLKELGDDPDSMEYYTDVIIDEANKMNRMVRKLMTLNQLEFANDGMRVQPFDIMEMITNLVQGSKKMREEHNAQVTVEGPDSLMVMGDEFKIEEVVNNYYSNAYNHLDPPNKIRIFVEDLGPNVRINVQNTGKNIPQDEIYRIWVKFYKVDKARTRQYGGSGIGLSIVKAIMDSHGQECGVYNVYNGVVFWFEIRKATEEDLRIEDDYLEDGPEAPEKAEGQN